MNQPTRTLRLIESAPPRVFDLSPEEAETLRQIGKALASKPTLRLADDAVSDGEEEDEQPEEERTRLSVTMVSAGRYALRAKEAVGVIAAGPLQVLVGPKIPWKHLAYLLEHGTHIPRLDTQRAHLEGASDLWSLVASWLVTAVEGVLELDLIRDYNAVVDDLRTVRGTILLLPTARHYYAGRLLVQCEYEEFNTDTPLNRVLKAGVMRVVSSPTVSQDVRRRARRAVALMEEVGGLLPSDLRAEPDRRTRHYGDALMLAKQVLKGAGRTLLEGGEVAWTFLIPTPDMVEDGLRTLLQKRLGRDHVFKGRKRLTGTKMEVEPDLVFASPNAVGDIKYKVSKGGWYRPDLYQVVAFAEAYGVNQSLLIRFREPSTRRLRPIQFGETVVHEITWDTDEGKDPRQSADEVVSQVEAWLRAEPA